MFLTEIEEGCRSDSVSRLGVKLKSTSLYNATKLRPSTGVFASKNENHKKRSSQSAYARREHYINDLIVPIRSSSSENVLQRSYGRNNTLSRLTRSRTSLSQKIPEWKSNEQVQRFIKKCEHRKVDTPTQVHRIDQQYYMAGRRVWLKDKYGSADIREISQVPEMIHPVLETSAVDTLNALAKAKMESLEYRQSLTILRDGTRYKNKEAQEMTPAQRPPTSLSLIDTPFSRGRESQSSGKRSITIFNEIAPIDRNSIIGESD